MLTKTSYKYKLKPTKVQMQIFEQWLGTCRFLYNMGMDIKKDTWRKRQKGIGNNALMKQLTQAKKEADWLNAPHSQVLQNALDRLDRSYINFFEGRARYPKRAKKHKYRSFTFKQGVKLHPNTLRFSFPKIGKVKFFKDRYNENMTIQTATIIKQADGWYVSVTGNVSKKELPETKNKIGIDLGLTHFVVTSDGQYFDSPSYLRKAEKGLRKAQRTLSRKKKGSNNRKKAVKIVALKHKKVAEQRKDFLHKLSTKLIRENQSISVENLQITNMLKNHKLAKSISDAGWGMFKNMLLYKSEWYGRQYIEVNPANTSKTCNVCGNVNEDMSLSIREWTCCLCKTKHNRDENASVNIRNRGEDFASSLVGGYVRPVIMDGRYSLNQEPNRL